MRRSLPLLMLSTLVALPSVAQNLWVTIVQPKEGDFVIGEFDVVGGDGDFFLFVHDFLDSCFSSAGAESFEDALGFGGFVFFGFRNPRSDEVAFAGHGWVEIEGEVR